MGQNQLQTSLQRARADKTVEVWRAKKLLVIS